MATEKPTLTSDTLIPNVTPDQDTVTPAPLPKVFTGNTGRPGGGIPLKAAKGFVLSTARNDSVGRRVAVSRGMHLCRKGEGYVLNEDICDTEPNTNYLLLDGDVVTACTVEVQEQKDDARRKQVGVDIQTMATMLDKQVAAVAAREGDAPVFVQGTEELKTYTGSFSEPDKE